MLTRVSNLLALNILLWAAVLMARATPFSRFDGERLNFSMTYHGLPAATSTMSFTIDSSETGGVAVISARVDTKSLSNLLFHIHNLYECRVDTSTGLPISSVKRIDQKNIRQVLEIEYDRQRLIATTNWGQTWPITSDSYDLFSMIYRIRSWGRPVGDTLHLVLHIEGQLWTVAGSVTQGEPVDGPFSHQTVRKIILVFTPYQPIKARAWKTDLLTNRIARNGSTLTLWLGPPPQQLPLKLQFGMGKMRVTMKLRHVEKD